MEKDSKIWIVGIIALLVVVCCAALAVVLAALFLFGYSFGVSTPVSP